MFLADRAANGHAVSLGGTHDNRRAHDPSALQGKNYLRISVLVEKDKLFFSEIRAEFCGKKINPRRADSGNALSCAALVPRFLEIAGPPGVRVCRDSAPPFDLSL